MKSASVAIFASAAMAASYEVSAPVYAATTSMTAPVYPVVTPPVYPAETDSECSDEDESTSAGYTTIAPPPVYSTHGSSNSTTAMTHPTATEYPTAHPTHSDEECSDETSAPHPTAPQPTVPHPTYPVVTGGSVVVPSGTGGVVYPTVSHSTTLATHANTPVAPTSKPSVPATGASTTAAPGPTGVPTAGAAVNSVGMLAILGAAAAYFL